MECPTHCLCDQLHFLQEHLCRDPGLCVWFLQRHVRPVAVQCLDATNLQSRHLCAHCRVRCVGPGRGSKHRHAISTIVFRNQTRFVFFSAHQWLVVGVEFHPCGRVLHHSLHRVQHGGGSRYDDCFFSCLFSLMC